MLSRDACEKSTLFVSTFDLIIKFVAITHRIEETFPRLRYEVTYVIGKENMFEEEKVKLGAGHRSQVNRGRDAEKEGSSWQENGSPLPRALQFPSTE